MVDQIAAKKGRTPGQVALALLHAQGDDVFPVPRAKQIHRLEENSAVFKVQLTQDELHSSLPSKKMSKVTVQYGKHEMITSGHSAWMLPLGSDWKYQTFQCLQSHTWNPFCSEQREQLYLSITGDHSLLTTLPQHEEILNRS